MKPLPTAHFFPCRRRLGALTSFHVGSAPLVGGRRQWEITMGASELTGRFGEDLDLPLARRQKPTGTAHLAVLYRFCFRATVSRTAIVVGGEVGQEPDETFGLRSRGSNKLWMPSVSLSPSSLARDKTLCSCYLSQPVLGLFRGHFSVSARPSRPHLTLMESRYL
ncbi:hypothetical protein N658DRAFT_256027 [Parathielavia hyrcaniae]|uniref:Uncharacterized protein n=1 Tax=Parathielavia hyrcaniae TaxID=113614 RepID=A0AAN6PYQ7_9PEZI|nr:hypothetical protein N658DRAFT_256027 [Parathielavia hyrcaniae]